MIQAPYEFSSAASGVRGAAPRRGEHNAEVLTDWLSVSPEHIAKLEQTGTLLAEADV